jgi:hypothetical protein
MAAVKNGAVALGPDYQQEQQQQHLFLFSALIIKQSDPLTYR